MELNELEIKQNKFIERLTEDELNLVNAFKIPSKTKEDDFKNYITSNVDGWQLLQNTDKSFSVKLMLGYKSKSLPRLTNALKLKDWDDVLEFRELMDSIINKARHDIDSKNKLSLSDRLKGDK